MKIAFMLLTILIEVLYWNRIKASASNCLHNLYNAKLDASC